MREILIEELNKISTKQKEIKENLLKENFDDLHSVSRANKLTLSWLEKAQVVGSNPTAITNIEVLKLVNTTGLALYATGSSPVLDTKKEKEK